MKSKIIILNIIIILMSIMVGATWQETLESEFDIVETFDDYYDWAGKANKNCVSYTKDPSSQPRYSISSNTHIQDTVSNLFRKHCYYDRTTTQSKPLAIANHGNQYSIKNKSLRINWCGNNGSGNNEISGIKPFFGVQDDETGGYDDLHIFFMMYFPSDRFISETENDGSRDVGHIREGDQKLYSNSGKWVAINQGFVNEDEFLNEKVVTNACRWGWNEIHFHLKQLGPSNNNEKRVTLGTAETFGNVKIGQKDVTPYLDKLIGVEINVRQESSYQSGDGIAIVDFYVKEGENYVKNNVLNYENLNFKLPADNGKGCYNDVINEGLEIDENRLNNWKFNRINLDSNWRVQNSGDIYYSCGNYYNQNGNFERILECQWYVDDFILDQNEIASKYFNILLDGSENISDCIHEADLEPCDGVISKDELKDYIIEFLNGDVGIKNLFEAINIWKS